MITLATHDQQGATSTRIPRTFSSSMRRTDVSATAVMGPLVSGDRTTSRNGARYSIGRTLRQSAGDGTRDVAQSSSAKGGAGANMGQRGPAEDTEDVLTVLLEKPSTEQTEVVQQWVVSDLIVLHGGFGAAEGAGAHHRNHSSDRRSS